MSEAQIASHLSDAVARAQAPTSTATSTTSPWVQTSSFLCNICSHGPVSFSSIP